MDWKTVWHDTESDRIRLDQEVNLTVTNDGLLGAQILHKLATVIPMLAGWLNV